MENRGWGNSSTLDTGPVFTCIVTGDPRLPEVAYSVVRDTLDQLLAAHLPAVRIVYVWRTAGADHLAGRYARERKLDINFVADRSPEILDEMSFGRLSSWQPAVFVRGARKVDTLSPL